MTKREVNFTSQFAVDLGRERKGKYGPAVKKNLRPIVDALVAGQRLSPGSHDHALKHEWAGCRACHIKPDLVLIYQEIGDDLIIFHRLGSHARVYKK